MVHIVRVRHWDNYAESETENSSSPESPQEGSQRSATASMTAGLSSTPLSPISRVPRVRISRVPRVLRKVNEEAYTPQLVSIGPYHHGMKRLKPMEKHKIRYQSDLFLRSAKVKKEQLLQKLNELEEIARGSYEDSVNYNSTKFVDMMLLDGCFIIELLFKYSEYKSEVIRSDQLFRSHSMIPALRFDMILLENQLPFFILEEIFVLFTSTEADLKYKGPSFLQLVLHFFSFKSYLSIVQKTPKVNHKEPSHFLDLLRDCCLPIEEDAGLTIEVAGLSSKRSSFEEDAEMAVDFEREGKDITIPSAVELYNAGVKFTMVTKNSFMAMKFSSDGIFKIPRITIHDYTEVLFRNLLAFEQCFETASEQYITLYLHLMDSLINSPNDVAVLRRCGVIHNVSADDERVSSLFNKITKGTVLNTDIDFYRRVATDVKKYYNKRWNLFKAMLLREYFYSPWASASSVAVIIVVVCTIVQTFGTFFM